MQASDLKVGRIYSAKRPRVMGLFERLLNDRQIVYISPDLRQVQYDSPTVKFGQRLPMVDVEKFLKWAKEDVTDKMPKDEWRRG